MALVKCKECGEQVSTKAATCPKCGAKAPKKTSVVTWLVLIIIVFGVYSAMQAPPSPQTSKSQSTSVVPPTRSATESPSAPPKPEKPASAWSFHTSKDEMSGKTTKYITSTSKNVLSGWLRSGNILIGYTCGSGFYVRANDLGFTVDNLDCGQYGCTRTHYSRVKFDEGDPVDIKFSVWEKNHDGMSLQKRQGYPERDNENYLMKNMRASNTMYLEVELFNTKGRRQVAEFDLTGFTKAVNQCN